MLNALVALGSAVCVFALPVATIVGISQQNPPIVRSK